MCDFVYTCSVADVFFVILCIADKDNVFWGYTHSVSMHLSRLFLPNFKYSKSCGSEIELLTPKQPLQTQQANVPQPQLQFNFSQSPPQSQMANACEESTPNCNHSHFTNVLKMEIEKYFKVTVQTQTFKWYTGHPSFYTRLNSK